MYNRFPYSFEAYQRDPSRPAWVEAGLVTQKGTVVLFITHFGDGTRSMSGFMRSFDQGASWTTYESVNGTHVGYPVATAVDGSTNYIVYDSAGGGPHVLYVSTDDGRSWQKRSTLSLHDKTWYGALTLMKDGGLLAGAYVSDDEYHFLLLHQHGPGSYLERTEEIASRQEGPRPRAGLPRGPILSSREIGKLR